MTRLASSFRNVAVLLLLGAPLASLRAQRANALTAGVTRPVVARTSSTGGQRPEVSAAASGPDPLVAKGAIIGAGVGAALGIWMAVATRHTTNGPDHSADNANFIIFVPACAVVGALLGGLVAARL